MRLHLHKPQTHWSHCEWILCTQVAVIQGKNTTLTGPGAQRPLWPYNFFFHRASRPKCGALAAMDYGQKHTGPIVWSIWGNSDWKPLGPGGQRLLWFNLQSVRFGCWPPEPLDSLIGCVLANQRSVWEGRNSACAAELYGLSFSMHSVPSFPVFMFWITGTRLASPDLVQAQNVHATV